MNTVWLVILVIFAICVFLCTCLFICGGLFFTFAGTYAGFGPIGGKTSSTKSRVQTSYGILGID